METSREDAKPGAASLDSAFQSASTSPFRSEGEATPSGMERTRSAACPASGSSTQYPNPLVYGSRGEEILVDAGIRKSNNSLDAAGNSVETKQLPRRSSIDWGSRAPMMSSGDKQSGISGQVSIAGKEKHADLIKQVEASSFDGLSGIAMQMQPGNNFAVKMRESSQSQTHSGMGTGTVAEQQEQIAGATYGGGIPMDERFAKKIEADIKAGLVSKSLNTQQKQEVKPAATGSLPDRTQPSPVPFQLSPFENGADTGGQIHQGLMEFSHNRLKIYLSQAGATLETLEAVGRYPFIGGSTWCQMITRDGGEKLMTEKFHIKDDLLRIGLEMQANEEMIKAKTVSMVETVQETKEVEEKPNTAEDYSARRLIKRMEKGGTGLPELIKVKSSHAAIQCSRNSVFAQTG